MPDIKKSKIVPYTHEQMYALVNDIKSYADFVPWCTESAVLESTEDEIQAKLTFSSKGMSKSFTTLNRLMPHKMIEIRLIDGPFKHLEGFWQFEEINDKRSRISLDLQFEFSGRLLAMMFGPIFNQVASTLVEAFYERAKEVYTEQAV
jgi:ribosome-associated toxin RatA of RatAB toxin-antitoxin module